MAEALGEALGALSLAESDASKYREAISTATKLLTNCVEHPKEPKYRRVRCGNAALRRRLLDVGAGKGKGLLLAAGFVEESGEGGETFLVLPEGTDGIAASLRALKGAGRQQHQQPPGDGPARAYVRRTAPAAPAPPKKLSLRKLQKKWFECSELLRLEVRGAPDLAELRRRVGASRDFLAELEAVAQRHDALQGDLLQRAEVVQRAVPAEVLDEVGASAERLRALVRIKIADDQDLDTTRVALNDVATFLLGLDAFAERKEVGDWEVMENLLAPP